MAFQPIFTIPPPPSSKSNIYGRNGLDDNIEPTSKIRLCGARQSRIRANMNEVRVENISWVFDSPPQITRTIECNDVTFSGRGQRELTAGVIIFREQGG